MPERKEKYAMVELGESITLDDNREYLCVGRTQFDNKDYIFLAAIEDPTLFCFANQAIIDGKLQVSIIENKTEKDSLVAIFKKEIEKQYPSS